jgi:hypothetical protein
VDQKTILLNGGRDLDVAPVTGADDFLSRLLGGASDKPAVPTLRVVKNDAGRPFVAVFVGGKHVGFLSQAVDEELIATLEACDLNGAVARARGHLIASWDTPGRVNVRVSLAESDRLLSGPAARQPDESAPSHQSAPLGQSVSPSDSAQPQSSAGCAQDDWPEWPSPKPQPAPTQPVQPSQPAQSPQPVVAAQSPQPVQSMQALLPTRSAWLGATPQPAQAAQAGWLGGSARLAQTAQPAAAVATGTTSADLGQSDPWDGGRERLGNSEEQWATGWTPGASVTRTTPQAKPTGMSSRTKAWLISALVVAVLATAGFLVWKTQFANKAYTDPEYGYSFSYPAGWEEAVDANSALTSGAIAAGGRSPADSVVVGNINEQNSKEIAGAFVAVYETGIAVDELMMSYFMEYSETMLAQLVNQNSAVSVGIVEPLTETTVGGLSGYKFTISIDAYGVSALATYNILLDRSRIYVLGGMATAANWDDSQKAFDAFIDSFKPGDIQR